MSLLMKRHHGLLRLMIFTTLVCVLALAVLPVEATASISSAERTSDATEDLERASWFPTSKDSVVQFLASDGSVLDSPPVAGLSMVPMARSGEGFIAGADALLDAYVIRIVASPNAERLRPYAELVARELSRTTASRFSVAPGVIASPSGGAGNIDFVATASSSPCGSWGTNGGGTWGCGGFRAQYAAEGMVQVVSGTVWLAPFAAEGLSEANLTTLLLHEFGHAVSLGHYRELYNGQRQVMYPQISAENHSSTYRSGDMNGLRYLTLQQGGVTQQPPTQTVRLDPQNQAWIQALLHDMLGTERAATVQNEWLTRAKSGLTRIQMARFLAGSETWTEKVVSDLYQEALGRNPDAGGASYWGNLLASGVQLPTIAAAIWGSPERVAAAGSAEEWVRQLYLGLLNRNADATGLAYWLGETGKVGFPRVASSFYQSQEKRLNRVQDQYKLFLNREPDTAGARYWARRVLQVGDLELTVELVNSEEYRRRAVSRFPKR